MNADPPSKRLIRRLNRITNARPALGLRLAALAGFLGQPWLGDAWSPSRDEFEELLGACDDATFRRMQRRIAAAELRNRAVIYMLQRKGPAGLEPLIRVRNAEPLAALRDAKAPVAILTWNLGAIRATTTGLHALGYTILGSINRPPPQLDPGFRWLSAGNQASGSQFLLESLKVLQSGGLPVIGLGPRGPQARRIPFLGRSIPVPLGAGYLADRAGARLMPATATWIGLSPRIELTLHDPIPEPPRGTLSQEEWEFEMLTAAVSWFDSYMRAHPDHLRPVNMRHVLQHLREHPRAPSQTDFDELAESFEP